LRCRFVVGVSGGGDVARGHDADGGGDDRPPTHHIPTGCEGCFVNRGKGTRKPNLGGRKAGMLHTRQETRNLGLKKITDDKGPVPIWFEWNDKKTMMPLDDHVSHWSKYLGELIREMPLYYPSWQKVLAERKAAIVTKMGAVYWVINPETGTYDVESIRQRRPENIIPQIGIPRLPSRMIPGTKPEQLKIAKTGQRARSYAGRDPDGELSHSRVPVTDPQLLRDTHCWRGGDVEVAGSRLQHPVGCALH
nr:hypothetical protein [Tanacetum cinerariifolium]